MSSLNLARFAFRSPISTKSDHQHDKISEVTTFPTIPCSDADIEVIEPPPKRRKNPKAQSASLKQKMEVLRDVRLPDYLALNLDILFVGFNPGRNSASHGHHYSGPGNHFWKSVYRSGLVPEALTFQDDARVLDFHIGLTNIVDRPSTSSSELTKAELRAGAIKLRRKIAEYQPKIVAFNGLGIYEEFSGRKDFDLGKQPEGLHVTSKSGMESDVILYVMPSSSPRGTKWPTLESKLPFYEGLRHLREFILGRDGVLKEGKVVFRK